MLDGFIQWEGSAQTGVKTMKGNDLIVHRGSNEEEISAQRESGRDVNREARSSMTLTRVSFLQHHSQHFSCISYFPAGVTRGSVRRWKETR